MTDWPLPSLTELPTALIELILAKLDPQGLCNVSRTCSHLFRLASQTRFWEKHLQHEDDLVLSATKHCLASVLHLPHQVFSIDLELGRSERFPLICRLRTAASTSIPHVCKLLGINDVDGLAENVSSALQEMISCKATLSRDPVVRPIQPCDILAIARADRGAVRLALSTVCAILLIQKDLSRSGWPAPLRTRISPRWKEEVTTSWFVDFHAEDSPECGSLLHVLSLKMGLTRSAIFRRLSGMVKYMLLRHRFQIVIDQRTVNDTSTLVILGSEALFYPQLESCIGECCNVMAVREHLQHDLARICRLCSAPEEGPPNALPPWLSWDALNGADLAFCATLPDLRLALHLRQSSRVLYRLEPHSGRVRLAATALTAAMNALSDVVIQVSAHAQSAQHQKLLPSVQSSVKTDLSRLADGLEQAVKAASLPDKLGGTCQISDKSVDAHGAPAGSCSVEEPHVTRSRRDMHQSAVLEVIQGHIAGLQASQEGRQSLLRCLLQLEAVRVLELGLTAMLGHVHAKPDSAGS